MRPNSFCAVATIASTSACDVTSVLTPIARCPLPMRLCAPASALFLIGDHHSGTTRGKVLSDGKADAHGSAGHDGDCALKAHATVPPVFVAASIAATANIGPAGIWRIFMR